MEEKNVAVNRVARHEYFVLETLETGIVLSGSEVKSCRLGNVNLKDGFCMVEDGELFLKNVHFSVYDKGGAYGTKDARRDRKLLLHKSELIRLFSKVSQKGLTLVPLRIYFKGSLVKVELGLCKGKHNYDKKQSIMEKDVKRLAEREIKNYN